MPELEHQPIIDADNPDPNLSGTPKFSGRDEVEESGLLHEGSWVSLQYGTWKGERRIWVKAWRLYEHRILSHQVLTIMRLIFPEDTFFLAHLAMTEVFGAAETHARLYDLIYNKLYDHVMELIYHSCEVTDDERSQFERTVTLMDILAIFIRIVEQEFNNDYMQALLGKFHRLIADKVPSEAWLPSIQEFTEAISQASGTSPSPNSKFSYNMPPTGKPENSYMPIEQMPPQKKDGTTSQ